MIHIPPLPLYDSTTTSEALHTDLCISGTFELDFTAPKDSVHLYANQALGKVWNDTVDASIYVPSGFMVKMDLKVIELNG